MKKETKIWSFNLVFLIIKEKRKYLKIRCKKRSDALILQFTINISQSLKIF